MRGQLRLRRLLRTGLRLRQRMLWLVLRRWPQICRQDVQLRLRFLHAAVWLHRSKELLRAGVRLRLWKYVRSRLRLRGQLRLRLWRLLRTVVRLRLRSPKQRVRWICWRLRTDVQRAVRRRLVWLQRRNVLERMAQ
jgi:hypothetical protein